MKDPPLTIVLPAAPTFGAPVAQPPAPEVLDFLATRRSSSAVNLAEPGPSADEIDTLIRLAARVPDHGKLAPWRFIILTGPAKVRFADALEALANRRGDTAAVAKLAKVKLPPLAIVVVASPKSTHIPAWEQQLSAGAVCTTLLYSALAMGYGANWITDWYSYDPQAAAIMGLSETERVAGFILLGTPRDSPFERERPDPATLVTHWQG